MLTHGLGNSHAFPMKPVLTNIAANHEPENEKSIVINIYNLKLMAEIFESVRY